MAKKKLESSFVNMLVVLFLVSFVASASLAFVNKATQEPRAKARLDKKTNAIKNVLPEFDNNPIDEVYKIATAEGDSLECYPGKKNGKEVGIAIKTFTKNGFSGEIWLMVGFKPDGTINNISVLEHKETPGLGDKMEKKKTAWSEQFNGKNPKEFNLKVKQDNGEVDAITASTISSRAYCDAVDRAYKSYFE